MFRASGPPPYSWCRCSRSLEWSRWFPGSYIAMNSISVVGIEVAYVCYIVRSAYIASRWADVGSSVSFRV